MMFRFAIVPLLPALNFSMCKKHETVSQDQKTCGRSNGPGDYFLLSSFGRQDPLPGNRDHARRVRSANEGIEGPRHHGYPNAGSARMEARRKEHTAAMRGRY